MAAHAHLKNEIAEDDKCHNLMSWLISLPTEWQILCQVSQHNVPSYVPRTAFNIIRNKEKCWKSSKRSKPKTINQKLLLLKLPKNIGIKSCRHLCTCVALCLKNYFFCFFGDWQQVFFMFILTIVNLYHAYQSLSCATAINIKNPLRGVSEWAVEESKMHTVSKI